jgi:hypothetical protein
MKLAKKKASILARKTKNKYKKISLYFFSSSIEKWPRFVELKEKPWESLLPKIF